MKFEKVILTVIGGVALVAAFAAFKPAINVSTSVPAAGITNNVPAAAVVDRTITQDLGAQSTQLTQGDALIVNNAASYPYSKPMTLATTTICSFKSPPATTTLNVNRTAVRFTTSTSTDFTITFAKGTAPNATTTIIGNQMALGANDITTVYATTTSTQDVSQVRTIAPNTYLNISLTGGSGTFSPVGTCSTEFFGI